MPAEKLVIIGNGMAPGRMLEHLFERAPGRYQVTIFNAEPRVNYDRIMLSPVLSGEKAFEEIVIHGDGWYIAREIMLHKGVRVTQIDRAAKTITTNTGHVEPYDKLVIATGSVPIIIPVPGANLAGVLTYRDLYREVNLIYAFSEQLASRLELRSVAELTLDQARQLIAATDGGVLLRVIVRVGVKA